MASVETIRAQQAAKGTASILAIGTANPPTVFYQEDYPDFYFRVTNSENKTDLKAKFKRICDRSMIKKRHQFLTEKILRENESICKYKAPSLDARQAMLIEEIPKLGYEAAVKALQEWGRPLARITHIIFGTSSGVDSPGADYQLMKLLGLPTTVNRVMLYNQGCFAGGAALRLAKDLAENNAGARVLVVCEESVAMFFHAPCETHIDVLVGQAIWGDGAGALVIGSDPDPKTESYLFQIVSAAQMTVPDTEDHVALHMKEMGMEYYLSAKVPEAVGEHINECFGRAVGPVRLKDANSFFYAVHTGGRAILDKVDEKLGLKQEKLRASRQVLRDYGNMGSACVFFILDDIRRRSEAQGQATTGEGLDWGLLFGFGPGLTIETILLHSVPFATTN